MVAKVAALALISNLISKINTKKACMFNPVSTFYMY
jgi:hypothetical protein